MGLSKTEIFTAQQNELAKLAKVLGHPARIAILEYLFKTDACICGDIVDELGLAQATVSQHLKELKNMGLIQGDVEGTKVCYCVNKQKWNELAGAFASFFENKLSSVSCC